MSDRVDSDIKRGNSNKRYSNDRGSQSSNDGSGPINRWMQRPIMLVVVVAVGALIASKLVGNRAPPERSATELPPRAVEVMTVAERPFRSQVTGYGYVEPSIVLPLKAEVTGKVAYLHPGLKQGASLSAGDVAVRIDPEDYEVSLKQTQAELDSSRYTLEQLKAEEKTSQRSLSLSKQNLAVGKKELERVRELYERKLIAKSALEAEEQRVIQLEQSVTELEGKLTSNASRQRVEESKIERYQQGVKGQEQTLGRTEIRMPFNARIGEVQIEKGEFVTSGTPLFEALDVKGVEIEAEISTYEMFSLVSHLRNHEFTAEQLLGFHSASHSLGLKALVSLPSAIPNEVPIWTARVLRISESIDTMRRTLGIVVGVDNPYEKVIPGKRPPLIKGMYASVKLFGPKRQALVIPRRALHEGRVYLVNEESRLEIRPVQIELLQNELVVINEGLKAGEKIITSDLVPVIEGMPLAPIDSEQMERQFSQQAVGLIERYIESNVASSVEDSTKKVNPQGQVAQERAGDGL